MRCQCQTASSQFCPIFTSNRHLTAPPQPRAMVQWCNGAMVAFEAYDQKQVSALHAAALNAGGTDEGAPGFRPNYGPRFYVGYLRDPQGNKIALYSSHPDDPTRDG